MSKNEWSNMYYCVNILLTKNALEHVHLEDELVQNQLHIAGQADLISFSCIHVASVHFPVEAEHLLTSMGLI